ncbi:MAG: 3-hydroxyacyl-ACP dehydratase FabZ [Gammaproteobacteria bacterium WSBS_2016_MAG_OTU1]
MTENEDIQLIMRALPHRHPFLLVDRVLEYEAGKFIKARKNVTISEPFFEGHFPDMPVMPGVLILESLAQTCGVLSYLTGQELGKESSHYFLLTGLDKCRFRKMVVPGDSLTLYCTLERRIKEIFRFAARAEVDGEVVCNAQILAARASKE